MNQESKQKSINRIAKGGALLVFGLGISRVLSYIYKILVARIGVHEFGLFSASTAVIETISTIAALGLPSAIFFFIPYYRARNEEAKISGVISSSLKLSLLLSIVFSAILFFSSDVIAVKFLHAPAASMILKILAFIIPVRNVRNIFVKVLVAFQRVDFRVYARNMAEDGIRLLATSVLLVMGFGLMGAIYGYMAGMAASALVAVYLLKKTFSPAAGAKAHGSQYKEIVNYATPLFLTGFVGYFLRWTDTFVLSYFRTMEEVGLFNVAMIAASFVTIVPEFFMPAAYPIIVSNFAEERREEAMHLARVVNKWIFICALPLVVFLSLFLREVVAILFGKRYMAVVLYASILLFGKLAWTMSNMGSNMLTMKRKNVLILYANIVLVISNIVLDIALIPRFGIMGATISTAFVLFLEFFIFVNLVRKHFGISLLPPKMLKIAIIGVAALMPGLFMRIFYKSGSMLYIGMEGVIYFSVYLVLLWVGKILEEDDLSVIRSAIQKVIKLKESLV